MDAETLELMNGFSKSIGASDEALGWLSRSLGVNLPRDFLEFLKYANGAEGFVADAAFVMLFSIEEIVNATEWTKQYAPSLVQLGSNGGDAGYYFDVSRKEMPVVEIPYLDLASGPRYTRGASFLTFLKYLAEQR